MQSLYECGQFRRGTRLEEARAARARVGVGAFGRLRPKKTHRIGEKDRALPKTWLRAERVKGTEKKRSAIYI
eukprot:2786392-Pleurochrysis_carterae.AAC.4